MANQHLAELHEKYSDIIAQMPDTFDSHQFILKLAHENQELYVKALYHYRNHTHRGKPAPFSALHLALSQHLSSLSHLVKRAGNTRTNDIFGHSQENAQWTKV